MTCSSPPPLLTVFKININLLMSPQVTVPLGFHEKCPVSVSFIARHGGDRFLLDTLHSLYVTLQEQGDIAAKSKVSKNIVVSREQSAEMAKEKVNLTNYY